MVLVEIGFEDSELDGTGSGSCPVAGFGVWGVEAFGSEKGREFCDQLTDSQRLKNS
jgi:hypothetical protein